MDGVSLDPAGAAGLRRPARLPLQPFLTACSADRRELYWRLHQPAGAAPDLGAQAEATLHARPGATLSFDSYFNSFFESQWRRYTALSALVLQVVVQGEAVLRVFRRVANHRVLLLQQDIRSGLNEICLNDRAINFRQHGVLSVDLVARASGVTFVSACWMGEDVPQAAVGLAAIFCTFNREAALARCLDSLGADAGALARLARVIVVNQGRPGLARHPAMAEAVHRLAGKLVLIEQGNHGGAGGFTRGLLAAMDDPALTHVVLLDDDIEIEPGSLARMTAFFALAKRDVVLGGHMLDMIHPATLYEAGAIISDRHWAFLPQHHGRHIGNPDTLEALSHPAPVHYNGWWCCGFPIALLQEHGLPLPCFIRGDDLEWGLRLHNRGVPTVPMPGIAVWHEPFYLKLGGWQLYYETRNMLVAAALHLPADRAATVRRLARQVVRHLLTFRYYSTALLLDGIQDFLAGPGIMRAEPLAVHAGLAARKAEFPDAGVPRERVLAKQLLRPAPRTTPGSLALLARLVVRNALARTQPIPPRQIAVEDLDWMAMSGVEHVAVETWWDNDKPSFHRSREHHRALLLRGARLLLRLYREGPATTAAWQAAFPELTSVPFWQSYLKLAPARALQPRAEPASACQAD